MASSKKSHKLRNFFIVVGTILGVLTLAIVPYTLYKYFGMKHGDPQLPSTGNSEPVSDVEVLPDGGKVEDYEGNGNSYDYEFNPPAQDTEEEEQLPPNFNQKPDPHGKTGAQFQGSQKFDPYASKGTRYNNNPSSFNVNTYVSGRR